MITEKDKGEICQEYRLSKNKDEQIHILAQLHATNTAAIRGILHEGGVYSIGPNEIIEGAEKILGGVTFGALRNYKYAFAMLGAKECKKLFKDYAYQPWGDNAELRIKAAEMAKKALEDVETRAQKKKESEPKKVNPPLADPKRDFTPEETRILINGLLSIRAENIALQKQLNADLEKIQETAQKYLDAADAKLQEIRKIEADIAQGELLLTHLRELNAEEQTAETA